MSKISISKKTAWSLILKINTKISCNNNLVNINEDISGQTIGKAFLDIQESSEDTAYVFDISGSNHNVTTIYNSESSNLVEGNFLKE